MQLTGDAIRGLWQKLPELPHPQQLILVVLRTDDRLPPSLARASSWAKLGGSSRMADEGHDEMLAVPAREQGRREVLRGVRRASGADMWTLWRPALSHSQVLP
jgi:hypothetical protein